MRSITLSGRFFDFIAWESVKKGLTYMSEIIGLSKGDR